MENETTYRVVISVGDDQPQEHFEGLTLKEAVEKLGSIETHVCWAQMHEETDIHKAHREMREREAAMEPVKQ